MLRFNASTNTVQNFGFGDPTMRYIVRNASVRVLHNLIPRCKWFNARSPIHVINAFRYSRTIPFSSIIMRDVKVNDLTKFKAENLFIVNELIFVDFVNRKAFSAFRWQIRRLTATKITLHSQDLSPDELNILIGHGNVEDLELINVKNSDGVEYNLEDILIMTPRIETANLKSVLCTSETAKVLNQLRFENELRRLDIGLKNHMLDPVLFAEFVTKNCSTDARIILSCAFTHKREYVERVRAVFHDVKIDWIREGKSSMFNII